MLIRPSILTPAAALSSAAVAPTLPDQLPAFIDGADGMAFNAAYYSVDPDKVVAVRDASVVTYYNFATFFTTFTSTTVDAAGVQMTTSSRVAFLLSSIPSIGIAYSFYLKGTTAGAGNWASSNLTLGTVSTGLSTNRAYVRGSSGQGQASVTSGGSTVSSIFTSTVANGVMAKMAMRVIVNNQNGATNGVAGTADTNCAIPVAPDRFSLGPYNNTPDGAMLVMEGVLRAGAWIDADMATFTTL